MAELPPTPTCPYCGKTHHLQKPQSEIICTRIKSLEYEFDQRGATRVIKRIEFHPMDIQGNFISVPTMFVSGGDDESR